MEQITVRGMLAASPDRIYAAWIDGEGHTTMTGSPATVDPHVGGAFSAWDGYITGTTLALEPGRRIVQAWRSTDFPEEAGDSHVEIELSECPGGTEILIRHTDIPAGQGPNYAQGWEEFYLTPMAAHFGELAEPPGED